MTDHDKADQKALEDFGQAPVVSGAERPAIVFHVSELATANPERLSPQTVALRADLPDLRGTKPPRTLEDKLCEALRLQLASGDLSIESVADRFLIGPRTLQRQLKSAGTSFRNVRNRFASIAPRGLLLETDLSIQEIAKSLDYREANSFRKSFRTCTGLSPSHFRASPG